MAYALRLIALPVVLALSGGPRMAAAQTPPSPTVESGLGTADPAAPLQFTPEQRAAILDAVRREKAKVAPPPAGIAVAVGAQLPPAIELRILPELALAQAPQAKTVQYTMIADQVVLVDPTNMRIVEILGR